MVEGAVVEPGGHLGVGVRRRVVGRRVREAGLRIERRERVAARVVTVVELGARRVDVREVGLVAVRRLVAFGVGDDVGGVVDDDVEVDLHAATVGVVDEVDHLGVAAEVGVDLRVVGLPVAVVARRRTLHPAVGERRGDPQGRHAHVLEVPEARAQAGEVAAVVPALAGRVVAVHGPVASRTALVVGVGAVGEAIGHHEVDDLVGRRCTYGSGDQLLVAGLESAADGDGGDVGGVIEAERDGLAGGGHRERDVVRSATGSVALRPALVHRRLPLVGAGRESTRRERVDAVAVDVLQPRAQAVREPVAGAAELVLEAARGGGDLGVDIVGHPVRGVRVVEPHVRRRREGQGDVVGPAVAAVALGPRAVERRLVLPRPGRQGERPGPHVVAGLVRQARLGALRLPVTRTAELGLEGTGQRDGRRRRCLGDGG